MSSVKWLRSRRVFEAASYNMEQCDSDAGENDQSHVVLEFFASLFYTSVGQIIIFT